MTEEQIKMVREDYLSFITETVQEHGEIGPSIAVFADVIDSKDDKPALIEIPIPNEFLKDDSTKEHFVERVLPDLIKEFKKRFVAHSVLWTCEAWLRTAQKEDIDSIEDFKDIPIKTEAIVIIIDSKDETEAVIYEIVRPALSVSDTGELVEKEQKNKVELVEMPELCSVFKDKGFSGRFSNLYKKFTD
jgi:hypothetical protein